MPIFHMRAGYFVIYGFADIMQEPGAFGQINIYFQLRGHKPPPDEILL